MRYFILFTLLISPFLCCAQNITVDSQTFSAQQLIEDILIDSDCIENVVVTNMIGGDFNNTDQSYGFFDAAGTTFPFQRGIVLSTGRLNNVPGPNTSLSDDDASGWTGDNDLETILNETNTTNATILEFDFTAVASEVSFRYIFASEEYQDNNPNTCQFSDLFGFLIRPAAGQNQYTNIALVPDTQTPVKVTTVHPGVTDACPPTNETYFQSYNTSVSPINFNGQTTILTAKADVVPNVTYHVKLVIADEQNFRFDSAVFLEAGSFQLSTDLGSNRLVATSNSLCGNETLELDASLPGQNSYDWFRDGVLVQSDPANCLNCGTFTVDQSGIYTVEVGLANNCMAFGEVAIEYSPNPVGVDTILIECDVNQDGLTTYNLFDALNSLTNNDPNLIIANFYLNQTDAIDAVNEISTFSSFQNTTPNQIVYARVQNPANCFDITELELQIASNTVDIPDLEACDIDDIDGFSNFSLNTIALSISNQIPVDAVLSFFKNVADAFSGENALPANYENIIADFQTIFVKIESNNQCFAISEVSLVVLFTPMISKDETVFYCTNTFPETVRIFGGVLNDSPSNYFYQWQLNGTSTAISTSFNDVNEPGVYIVIITDPNGCSNSRTITVVASNIATIDNVNVIGNDAINTVTISVSGNGDYEFTLDNPLGNYQDSNVFTNILPGFHTVFVRDKNGCGVAETLISVLGFPKYFTPNGDNNNDTWQLDGVNFQLYPSLEVFIYDRYGKLLATQNANSSGFNGTYNGNQLPNADYWFTASFGDGRSFAGHFALKR